MAEGSVAVPSAGHRVTQTDGQNWIVLSLSGLAAMLRYPHKQLASTPPMLSSALDRSQTAADGHSLAGVT